MTTQRVIQNSAVGSDRAARPARLGRTSSLLIVAGLIGALVPACILAARAVDGSGAGATCAADGLALSTAVDRYLADHGLTTIPASGTDPGRFEETLVAAGYLPAASQHHDLNLHGVVVPLEGASC